MLRLKANFPRRTGKLPAAIRRHLATSLYLNAYVLATVTVLSSVSGFLFWLLAARLARDPAVVGLATAVISAATLLAGLSQLGIGSALVRFLSGAESRNRLVNRALTAVAICGITAAALFLAGIRLWSPALVDLTSNYVSLALFVLLLVALSPSLLLNWVFLALRKPVYTLAKHLLQVGLAISLLYIFGTSRLSYSRIMLAFTLSVFAGLLIGLLWLLPHTASGYRPRLGNPLSLGSPFMRYALPNFLVDQLQRAPDSLMTLLVVNLLGPAPGAYFFVAWAMLSGLQALASSAAMSLFAEGSYQPQAIGHHARQALRLGLLLSLVLALAAALLGRLALGLYGPDYAASGYPLLRLLAVSLIPGVVVPIFLSVLRVRRRMSPLVFISALSFGSGLALVYVGAMVSGLTGAGAGWLISRILMLFCVALSWKRFRQL